MQIKITKKEKWAIFNIDGRLDVKLSQDLDAMVSEEIKKGTRFILFNLEKVRYMSSSGLRVFISSMRQLKDKEGELKLSNMPNNVKKIMEVVDLEGVFNIFPTIEEALK